MNNAFPGISLTGRATRWLALALLSQGIHTGAAVAVAGIASPPILQAAGATRYVVDAKASDVRFLVYRSGFFAALGHNHVIRARRIDGDIYADADHFSQSAFQLSMPVDGFTVDNHADRAAEGDRFKEQPSSRAVADTTHNMLSDRVLDAARYPKVEVRSVSVTGTPQNAMVTARIGLRGVQHDLSVPVKIEVTGNHLVATGEFTLSQRKFGITPYSALAGGLRVKDEIKVRFRIVADKSTVTASQASSPRP